jgi:D-alanine-D-alanine ligase
MKIAIVKISAGNMHLAYPEDYDGREDISYCERAKRALEELGHTVDLVSVTPNNLLSLRKGGYQVVMNFADEGFDNNPLYEPHIPAMLDLTGLPYTGSEYFTLALCLDKVLTKKLLVCHKIPTPKFQEFVTDKDYLSKKLSFPLIVKPAKQDGSIGIKGNAVVRDEAALRERVRKINKTYNQPALVEEYVDGRELNVAVLGHGDKLEVLPIAEIDFSGLPESYEKICCYDSKWKTSSVAYQKTPPVCPANVDPDLYEELVEIAVAAFKMTGCRDYARVDFRVDKDGNPYVLEVNPNPCISDDAGLARMAGKTGLSYGRLLEKICYMAAERSGVLKDDIPINAEAPEADR